MTPVERVECQQTATPKKRNGIGSNPAVTLIPGEEVVAAQR